MRILVIFTFDYSLKSWKNAGYLDRELYFYNSLSANFGIKFTFLTYGDKDDFNHILGNENIDVIPIYSLIKFSKFKIIRYLKSFYLPFILNRKYKEYDMIKQNQLLGSWVAIILKLITKKKLLIRTGYDMYKFSLDEKKNIFKKSLYYILTFMSLKLSDLYTVTSNSDLKFLNDVFKTDTNIKIRKNWVQIPPSTSLKKYKNKIICVGRLEPQKNYDLLIKNLANSSIAIDIYGTGSLEDHLKKLAKSNNLNVNFLGLVDNDFLIREYPKYKVFVSSSDYEGNSKVILEAMAAGCIVIAKDIQNNRDIIENNRNGILLNNFSNIEQTLIDIFTKKTNNEEIAINAVNSINENNSINIISKQYKDDFSSLLK